ncbi:uncharacterized protein DSM5745_00217 [Aspergillus mulundensis]|uniref:Uncharacterized protein n=1 Tax=Aspergillus mulundensis TaxID=1810919 RepID=A0A3D8T2U7_9EURO|nr:hypothetical protein DSM5745_00217 [Aspergillus mulundensis]RDW92895.1 hypothetical protein DSM5745_00217 [Aspergillus mulundensis]
MYLLPSTALFSLLTLTLPVTINAQTQTSANCSVFNWDQNDPYLATYPPQRVSGASSCAGTSENLTCALTAEGDGQYSASNNISGLATITFTSVVADTVSEDSLIAPGFNDSVIGSIDTTQILRPGQSAYLNFTAYKFCYTGTVANCTEGVDNDTAVEACAPVWHEQGGYARLDGEYWVVNISASDVDQYEDPYANQVGGGGDGEGGALGLKGSMNSGFAVLAGLVVLMLV